jgi:elongation factor G
MGLARNTDINYGLVGVGYASNEAATTTDYELYPNLPVAMRNSGFINSIAYSLWLNDLDASKGSILFGGIDTEKYSGDLKALDVLPSTRSGKYYHFTVPMTGLRGVSSTGTDVIMSKQLPLKTILDSGTTLTYLPQDMCDTVWKEVGAIYVPEAQLAVVPCSLANNEGYFSFEFGGSEGPRINVTMDELVAGSAGFEFPRDGPYGGSRACVFGIQSQTNVADEPDAPYLLGDTFLRSAYVVYDLVNNQVAIASTEFNATKSNVVPFPSMGASIPSSTAVPTQNDTTNSDSGQGDLTASEGFQSAASPAAACSTMGLAAAIMTLAIVLL